MKKVLRVGQAILALLLIFSLCGTTTLAANVSVSATKSLSAVSTSSTVTLTWSKVSKASGYRVYQRVDGEWKKLTTQSDATYKVSSLTASTNYTFAVKVYRKVDGKTYWSSMKTVKVKTKAMPDIKTPTATATSNSVTLKWSKVSGATGYRVYQYQNKKWVKIKTTTATKYTVSSLKKATSYKFRVQAYAKTDSGTVVGDYSKTLTVKTTDPTKTKITSSTVGTTTVTLNWSKVSGATGYRVYQKNGSEWKKVASTSKLTYKVTKLKSNTKYTFMVRAYKKSGDKVTWYTKSDAHTVITKAASSDLTPKRIAKYQKLLSSNEVYLKVVTNDKDLGGAPLEIAKKDGNLMMKTSIEGMDIRVVYLKSSNEAYMIIDSIISYAKLTEDDLDDFSFSEIAEGITIDNVGEITVKATTYDGKNAICESYVDTVTGERVSYYFVADILVAGERELSNGEKDIMKFESISTSVDSSLFTKPPKYYINIGNLL